MYVCDERIVHVPVGTFDVQDANVSEIPGGVSITGVFSDTAEGCFIILSSTSPDLNDVFMALPDTSGPAIVTGLETGYYMVRIYDLTGGLPERKPAVIAGVEVTAQGEGEQEKNVYR